MEFKGTKCWYIQQDWNGDAYGINQNEHGVDYISIGDEGGSDCIHVFSDFTKLHEEKIENLIANAQLIAHAPEMLEMLSRVIKEHETDSRSWSTILEIKDLLTRATTI